MLVKLEYEGAAGDTAGGACDEREGGPGLILPLLGIDR